MILSANLLVGTTCFASGVDATRSDSMQSGLFFGIGGDYNSINLIQQSWGKGISNIVTNTGANSNGVGEGSSAPFNNTTQTLAPGAQIGYFKHFPSSPNLYGIKVSYQYLNSTATIPNLYIPQLGSSTNAITGAVSSLYGYVNVDSLQIATNHEFTVLPFLGRSFDNKYFYVGIGPSVFNIKSKNYYSIGYAEFDGTNVNVTGLVSYSSPSLWVLGGAAQLGMTYFITPSLFLDASYAYSISGSRTVSHQQTFANSSSSGTTTYATAGTLFTKNTMRVNNQSVRLTLNKVFDL